MPRDSEGPGRAYDPRLGSREPLGGAVEGGWGPRGKLARCGPRVHRVIPGPRNGEIYGPRLWTFLGGREFRHPSAPEGPRILYLAASLRVRTQLVHSLR